VTNVLQEVPNVPGEVDDNLQETPNIFPFFFKFENVKKISRLIKGLNNTEAIGMDRIPTSVLKKGVEVLAGPVSHMVNCSLAEGCVVAAFEIGRVHPLHEGKGKPRKDPASFCPVSILSLRPTSRWSTASPAASTVSARGLAVGSG
jgi:hypothetical protein